MRNKSAYTNNLSLKKTRLKEKENKKAFSNFLREIQQKSEKMRNKFVYTNSTSFEKNKARIEENNNKIIVFSSFPKETRRKKISKSIAITEMPNIELSSDQTHPTRNLYNNRLLL